MYQVGDVTGDHRFTFESKLRVLNQWILLWKTFGSSPKVVMTDTTIDRKYTDLNYSKDKISTYLEQVFN
jgi:phosphoribosylformylglycinamidine synthase